MKSDTTTPAQHPGEDVTHDVHVKRVPHDAWCHGRHNALRSGLTFREYLICLLRRSTPVRAVGTEAGGDNHLPATALTSPADGEPTAPAPAGQTRPDRDELGAGAGPSPHGQGPAPTPRPGPVGPLSPVTGPEPPTAAEPPVGPTPAATPAPGCPEE